MATLPFGVMSMLVDPTTGTASGGTASYTFSYRYVDLSDIQYMRIVCCARLTTPADNTVHYSIQYSPDGVAAYDDLGPQTAEIGNSYTFVRTPWKPIAYKGECWIRVDYATTFVGTQSNTVQFLDIQYR